MSRGNNERPASLSELPPDELLRYGRELGLELTEDTPPGEMVRRIRERQELLLELDRDALFDIVIWARRPVRKSASKEELARQIATIQRLEFAGLSHRGLVALARLRGLAVTDEDADEAIIRRLKRAAGVWNRLRYKHRAMVGGLLSKVLGEPSDPAQEEYRFLPELNAAKPSLQEHIAEQGVVGGIASKLKGVADDYVREKLDEIEARIDRKLDEIDRRLAEWRDREIANRLRIIKITLAASILVALLSLGYSYVRQKMERQAAEGPPAPASATTH